MKRALRPTRKAPAGAVLTGGLGRDIVFGLRCGSVVGTSRDTAHNVTRGADGIDLSGIDARPREVADRFGYGGKTAKANSVWYSATSSGVILRTDVTGDRRPEGGHGDPVEGSQGVRRGDLILQRL